MRLFLGAFVIRDRCDYWTLLLLAVEQVLIQALLLLRNESFLQGHRLLLLEVVHDHLDPVHLFLLLPDDLLLLVELFFLVNDVLRQLSV